MELCLYDAGVDEVTAITARLREVSTFLATLCNIAGDDPDKYSDEQQPKLSLCMSDVEEEKLVVEKIPIRWRLELVRV